MSDIVSHSRRGYAFVCLPSHVFQSPTGVRLKHVSPMPPLKFALQRTLQNGGSIQLQQLAQCPPAKWGQVTSGCKDAPAKMTLLPSACGPGSKRLSKSMLKEQQCRNEIVSFVPVFPVWCNRRLLSRASCKLTCSIHIYQTCKASLWPIDSTIAMDQSSRKTICQDTKLWTKPHVHWPESPCLAKWWKIQQSSEPSGRRSHS